MKLVFILLVASVLLLSGCTQPDDTADLNKKNTNENKIDVPTRSDSGATFSSGLTRDDCNKKIEKVEDCLANVAMDKRDESICEGINGNDFKAFFEKGEFRSYYTLNDVDPNKKDSDGDGLTDIKEAELGTNPNKADSDDDGLKDSAEMMNIDAGTIDTDPLKPDTDSDGFSDGSESTAFTDPKDPDDKPSDGDNDKLQDSWETKHGLNPSADDADEDSDSDGLTNLQEFQFDSNPQNKDSDGDGFGDKAEYDVGSCSNSVCGTDETPDNLDLDGDRTPDKEEIQYVEKNRAEKIQQAKYTCYAVLAIYLKDTSMCSKSGVIGSSATSTDFRPRCVDIINKISDPQKIAEACRIYSGTLNLARVKC